MGDEKDYRWVGTGQTDLIRANVDLVPEFDPVTADHLWTWALLYRATPGGQAAALLDGRNLLRVCGPACFYCEQIYTPPVAFRGCPGTVTF